MVVLFLVSVCYFSYVISLSSQMHSLRLHPDGVLETNLTTPTEVSLASVPTQGSSEKVTQVKNEVESLRKQVETVSKQCICGMWNGRRDRGGAIDV